MGKKWFKSDDDYLINNYANVKKEEIIKVLDRTWISIQSRASRLNLKKINVTIRGVECEIWSKKDIEYLKINYGKLDKDSLISILDRSWSSIQNKAFLLKIKRDDLKANVVKLIDGTNEAYYWLGFIMADGHFSESNQIQINLGKKDLEHLKKFANFVEYKSELIKPNISIGFSSIRDKLNDIFKISNNKTHNPCDLNKLSGDSFFSFIIGFIDGDGSISKKGYLSLVSHKNWFNNITLMVKEISNGEYYSCKIKKDGLCIGSISNIDTMKNIKNKIKELNLPILNRKWDRVEITKLSKKDRTFKNMIECQLLFNKGLSVKEIIEITKLSKSQVYKQRNSIKEKDLKRESERNL